MKTRIKNLFLLPALTAGLGLTLAGRVTAQTLTTLYSFTATSTNGWNDDGANPIAALILSSNTIFGTAYGGGSSGLGTVFKLNTDGTGFTNLHSFAATGPITSTNSEGTKPLGGLILSGNTLCGTAYAGGGSGLGTVFKLDTDGAGFTILHSFTALTNGTNSGLVSSANALYGTTFSGGRSFMGSVFELNTDGTGFTNLHSFNGGSDGANPQGGLTLSGDTLYGTTSYGGSSGMGTIFKINTDGTGFTNLQSFTDNEGARPIGGLILSGNTLYGTADVFGGSGGSVFAVSTNGTGFRTLHIFEALSGPSPGTNSDGSNPRLGFVLSGNTLYGTTIDGGSSGSGTIFSLSLGSASPPQLAIIPSGANVLLTWPTNAGGFTLQSSTNLVSAVWTNVSPEPVVVNGQNTVTNPISGAWKFYRLSQ